METCNAHSAGLPSNYSGVNLRKKTRRYSEVIITHKERTKTARGPGPLFAVDNLVGDTGDTKEGDPSDPAEQTSGGNPTYTTPSKVRTCKNQIK